MLISLELVTETGQERNCTASRAEVGGRMPCGNGYITKQEACWECGCCFVDDSNDNETVNVCYDPMNGSRLSARPLLVILPLGCFLKGFDVSDFLVWGLPGFLTYQGSFIFSLIHFILNFINPHHLIGL